MNKSAPRDDTVSGNSDEPCLFAEEMRHALVAADKLFLHPVPAH